MAENINKPVKIVDTALRDAPQSLIATRMSTEEMLPIVEKDVYKRQRPVRWWERLRSMWMERQRSLCRL